MCAWLAEARFHHTLVVVWPGMALHHLPIGGTTSMIKGATLTVVFEEDRVRMVRNLYPSLCIFGAALMFKPPKD